MDLTGVMRLKTHVMAPWPCKNAVKRTNANDELAVAA